MNATQTQEGHEMVTGTYIDDAVRAGAAEQAVGYRRAWHEKFPGKPINGSVKYLVDRLERIAGPDALRAAEAKAR